MKQRVALGACNLPCPPPLLPLPNPPQITIVTPPPPQVTLQVDILGPKSPRGGEFPHRRSGVFAWMHLASRWALLAQPTKGKEREGVVRGRWTPRRSGERPMDTTAYGGKGQGKGKGSREGRLGQGGRGRSQGAPMCHDVPQPMNSVASLPSPATHPPTQKS